jgi:hypothetical protein
MLTCIQTEGNKVVFNIEIYNMPHVRTKSLAGKNLTLFSPHTLSERED